MKLPINCSVDYFRNFLNEEEALEMYSILINKYHLDKSRLVINAGGKIIETDSFKILFSTEELIKINSHPEDIHGKVYAWDGVFKKLKEKVETFLNKEFQIAMCIFYPNGEYFAPYHFDQQTSGPETILPSISLGEIREFCFKENISEDIYSLNLANGSLLLMKENTQERYTHSLPKNSKYKKGRINITFREANYK